MPVAALSETHLRRPLGYDPHPSSSFAPLPPAFQSRREKKEAALAGQRAELDQILEPEYKSTYGDAESSSMGASRSRGPRTAGGFASDEKHRPSNINVRSSSSVASVRSATHQNSTLGGIYVDSAGKVHDTEFDPFGRVSEMNRKMSRRRSAFGSNGRKGSASSSSASGSDVDGAQSAGLSSAGLASGRRSVDGSRDGDDARKRVNGDRATLGGRSSRASDRPASGRGTPSFVSHEDGETRTIASGRSSTFTHNHPGAARARAGGQYVPSPLSPTSSQPASGYSFGPARDTPATVAEDGESGEETYDDAPELPEKETQITSGMAHLSVRSNGDYLGASGSSSARTPIDRQPSEKREIRRDGSVKITGFGAPTSPMPPSTPVLDGLRSLRVPDSARSGGSRSTAGSHASSESQRPPKPAERPREESFVETPAQRKRREERYGSRSGAGALAGRPSVSSLAIDTALASRAPVRVLPEIEILEDDDPRVIIPPETEGRVTRVQTKFDHVIRGPFSHALDAAAGGSRAGGTASPGSGEYHTYGEPGGDFHAHQRTGSMRSVPFSAVQGSGSILEEIGGGYLPSRWANGDKHLRQTEEDKEMYRPQEWGGRKGDLAGKPEEWK